MARSLQFKLGRRKFGGEISRVDRARLYGRVEPLATDKYGAPLVKAALDEDGATIIAAAGMGYQNDDGRWLHRAGLQATDAEGRPRESRPSSFDAPVELVEEESVDLDEYHLYEIETLYVLEGDIDPAPFERFLKDRERLYCFPFSYREGYEGYTGFLIPRGGRVFLAAGRRAAVEFVGKRSRYVIDEVLAEDESDIAEDELNFSMH